MHLELMANWIIQSLPVDREEPERALRFFALIRISSTCPAARDVVRCMYKLAAEGAWDVNSLADLNMLVYGLRENPELIQDVSTDVERILMHCHIRGELSGWSYIRHRVGLCAA